MREERIIVRPFEELRVEDYEGIKQVNEHGYVRLTGMIPLEKREEYLGLAREQTWVRITAMADDIQHILFYGIVESVKMHVTGRTYARSQSYDSQIIAWTYYWNEKIENEFPNKFTIDPNIVKAIIAQESSFGDNQKQEDKNPSRNVMQSLATGNSNVWTAAGINPYEVFSLGDHIPFKKLDGTVNPNGDLPSTKDSKLYENRKNNSFIEEEREKMHFQDILIVENIFEKDDNGKLMVVFDNVTSNMSIAVGVGVLAEKLDSKGSLYMGVAGYNEGDNYVSYINKHLKDMGCELIK